MDRVIEKKKWTPKKIATIAGATLFGLFIIYLLFFRDKSSRLYVEKDKLTIARVEQGRFQEFIPIDGVVQPLVTIYVDAVFGGRVEEIYIRDGAMVSEGEKILRLSNLSMEMQYIQQENHALEVLNNYQNTQLSLEQNKFALERQLADLDYQLDFARKDFNRKKQFYEENVISLEEYENAERDFNYALKRYDIALRTMRHDSLYTATQLKSIKESISRMQENIRMLNRNLDNLVIRAPISGQLSSFNSEVGETKNAGENLGQIDQTDGYKLRARIDERYVSRTHIGQNAEFEYGGKSYRLEISKIYSNITGGAFEVDLHFIDKAPEALRRGQTIQLRLQFSGVSEALIIPRGGFYQETGGNWIYVLDAAGNQAIKRNIRIGRQNIHHYEVVEGLLPGEEVIVSSYDGFGRKDRLIFR
ncbi:MAG: HlyD family efflux transporter periplasmic adaptor subunit [Bacteroidales bacterium]|jgi:HlyD family secretion protein|nr:HlyD family efflux transporter periplasmic adaptor subunit [Bacteroidales bacterium]NLM92642.1 HlyD family efflux transporter periplasmic adaptor subunit [Bacteroidales bacterium]